jgi:hypothetical protein
MRVHLRPVEHRAHGLDHLRRRRRGRLALLEKGDVAARGFEAARQGIDFEPLDGPHARSQVDGHEDVVFGWDQEFRLAFRAESLN